MSKEFWQLQLVKKSLKKKEKLDFLNKELLIENQFISLDLGCAQGILSYFLRQKGGFWVSTDQDFVNIKTSKELLKKNLVQIGTDFLPFHNESFDAVISLDYLEHLENDESCLKEINRVLKFGGQVIIATPHSGKFFILHKLRSLLGMKLEFYGHKREGYSLKDMKTKLEKAHFYLTKYRTFSKFFSEFLELMLNFFYIKLLSPKAPFNLRDGHIRPATSDEFKSKKNAFKIYSFCYPLVWLISKLDKLLFFQQGYGLMIWAKKVH